MGCYDKKVTKRIPGSKYIRGSYEDKVCWFK